MTSPSTARSPLWEIQRKLRSSGENKNSWAIRQGLKHTAHDVVNHTSVELYLADRGERDRRGQAPGRNR